jgi:U3 small nucleolar RNA-associated protein 4
MGYIPGSVSAFTPASTEDGQIVVARTDGSYELKAITSSSATGNQYANNLSAPKHRLITIAETAPMTGQKTSSDNLDDDSNMEEDSDVGPPEPCPDAASSLCWVYPSSTPVCVGSGPNGNVWIVDFKESRPIDVVSSGGGGIFDLSTCKFYGDAASGVKSLPFVAGACEDGSVRLWRISMGSDGQGQIHDPPLVTLPSAGAPVLSLTWKNVSVLKEGRSTTFQTVVFAAIADGTIRKYSLDIEEQSSSIDSFDSRSNGGKVTDTNNYHYSIANPPKSIMRMTIENKGRKDPTKVWTMLLLQDNTLVVGTSLGQVQFWDGETGTLTQTVVQSNSQADVLKIVANPDETKLFCSGVDSRVVCLERKKPPVASSTQVPESELTALVTSHLSTYRPWKMTISQRPHTHDVKAMAIVTSSSNNQSSSIETLLTGGLDTKICSYSVSMFAHTPPQTWYPWPSATSLFSSTTCAPKDRPKLVAMQRHDCIQLYELETLKSKNKANRSKYLKQDVAQYHSSIPVGKIQLGGPDGDDDEDDNERSISSSFSPLQASSLSPNGKYLAVSSASSTYLFLVKYVVDKTNNAGSMRLKPSKVELPKTLQNVSATTFLFTDNELYIGDSSGHQRVHVLRLPSERQENDERRMDVDGNSRLSLKTVSLPKSQESNIVEDIRLPIQSIHADGEFMVTTSHARENAVHVFRRKSSKASYEHFWTLPSLGGAADARPAAVALLGGNRLAVSTYRSHVYVLDIETRSLNEWSEQYGFPIKEKKWTEDSLCGRGYPLRLIPQQNGRLVMVRMHLFCIFNMNVQERKMLLPIRPSYALDVFWGLSILQDRILVLFRPLQANFSWQWYSNCPHLQLLS